MALPSLGFEPMTTVLFRDVLNPLGVGPVEEAGPTAVEGPRLALAASMTAFSRARAASAAVGARIAGAVRVTTGAGAAVRAAGAGVARTTGVAAGAVRVTTGAGAAARAADAGAGDVVVVVSSFPGPELIAKVPTKLIPGQLVNAGPVPAVAR